jgi:hypothetical protein
MFFELVSGFVGVHPFSSAVNHQIQLDQCPHNIYD